MSFGSFENIGAFIRECNNSRLRYDQACLQISTDRPVEFWSQSAECEGCILQKTASILGLEALTVNTRNPLIYSFKNGQGEICNGTYQFGEYGQYYINVTKVTRDSCLPRMTAEPDAAYLPILTLVVILLAMATLWYVIKGIGKRIVAGRFYARYFASATILGREVLSLALRDSTGASSIAKANQGNTSSTTVRPFQEDNELGSETRVLTTEASVQRSPTRARLRSLDIFRGFSIALMVFVNAGGGGYDMFSHSVWNGLTVADLVYPWFAFAMGEALVLSLNARLRTSLPRIVALQQVARRALLLALIGVVLSSRYVTWADVRLPGVLQRLAAMYLVVGAIECAAMKTSQNITPGRSLFRDISAGWPQWLATIALVAIQVCITLLVPAPGCPRGYMGPGGLHLSLTYGKSLQNCTAGIAGYIDRYILGEAHLYKGGTFKEVYMTTVPHDPEGLLGILSGVLVVQAGAHATRIMLAYNHARARIMRWVFWSIVLGVSGGALCMFSKNDGVIPINKNLWSLSYCLVASSLALFIQAALFFIVDLKTKWGGRPLYYAGQNALFLYVGSELLKKNFPLHWAMHAPTHAQLLAAHACAMLIWLAVGVALHRKRIFITL